MDNKLSNSEIEYLAEKYRMGNLSQDEQAKFDQWYAGFEDSTFVHSGAADPPGVRERMYKNLWERIDGTNHPRRVRLWPRIAVAASIAIAVMTGGYFLYHSITDKDQTELAMANDIAPGKNGATLTLANGKKVYINDALIGNIADESGVMIFKGKDGQIIYELTGKDNGILTYNTLTTTRGEQSQVRLPDGTLVFLNSETSLRYPTSFTGAKTRTISLSGEAYFQVAKDKSHPFIVESRNQKVEVLGTHFNVSAYADEPRVSTTLQEGSVKVTAGTETKILKPDQQSVLRDGKIEVRDVDATFDLAWKEGFFLFNREPLESIMLKISRWYDIDVSFADPSLRKETFLGTISRFENVSTVLNMLEQTGGVKFQIEGNKIIIDRKK